MANDTDIRKHDPSKYWGDVVHLIRLNKREQAGDLLDIYRAKFIDFNDNKAEELRQAYVNKYGSIAKYW